MRSTSLLAVPCLIATCFLLVTWSPAPPASEAQIGDWEQLGGRLDELRRQGKYLDAVPLAQDRLHIAETRFGPDHSLTALTLNTLGFLYRQLQRSAEAEQVLRRALEICERLRPEQPECTALSLEQLGELLVANGRYTEAQPLFERELPIRERQPGPGNLHLALTLNNLGDLYDRLGVYAQSEAMYLRDLEIVKAAAGQNDERFALLQNNLANVYIAQGLYRDAEPLLVQALAVREQAQSQRPAEFVESLQSLATLYELEGRFTEAEPLLGQLAEARGTNPPISPWQRFDEASRIENMAVMNTLLHRYGEAERLANLALQMRLQVGGPEHPEVAESLTLLGLVDQRQGKLAAAEPLFLRALALNEKQLGHRHPKTGSTELNLAALYYGLGRPAAATPYFERAFEILAAQFDLQFSSMSERQRLAYMETVSYAFPLYMSFVSINNEQTPALAGRLYDLALWEKGLVAASVTAQRSALAAGGDAQALALFDQLTAKRSQAASLSNAFAGSDQRARQDAERLASEADQLERELVRRSASFADARRLVRPTWQQVAAALKDGEAAVEFVRFPFHGERDWTGESRYLALVATPRREPVLVALGDAREIDGEAVRRFLRWAESPASEDSPPLKARLLGARVWQPLEKTLGNARRIYVSLDGELNQLALGVVPLEDGTLLLDRYDLRLLVSTKDLLRSAATPRHTAVLMGDPAFGLDTPPQRADLVSQPATLTNNRVTKPAVVALSPSLANSGSPSHDFRGWTQERPCPDSQLHGQLCPLPATQEEVNAVASELEKHHWEVERYSRERALKRVLLQVSHPQVVHLATHGFFEPDLQLHLQELGIPIDHSRPMEDPMLRSGLFFAGANRALRGEPSAQGLDDGVLTAYEAAQLDLHGTELVVLSACDTGLGTVRNGEGVFGLRRAFQEAGARAVLMSMWPVPDRETKELMALFYRNWLRGGDKATALRDAQRQMRRRVKARYGRARPFYWGAFVLVGT